MYFLEIDEKIIHDEAEEKKITLHKTKIIYRKIDKKRGKKK